MSMKPSLWKTFKQSLSPEVQQAFREFGRLGGKKGGAKGGKARAQRMTAAERSKAARKAVKVRWAKVRTKR